MSRLRRGEFAKYHALGNDYLLLDPSQALSAARARALCDRHRGIGADGVLAFGRARSADFAVRIRNPDGSPAEKSGNGLRIFARALFDLGYTRSRSFEIETSGGRVRAELSLRAGRVRTIRIGMGRATLSPAEVLDVAGAPCRVVPVSVGNPHCVVFVDALDDAELLRLGPALETHGRFPERTNVQLVQVLARDRIALRIWERGAGVTLASGSSSCAAAAAGFALGHLDARVRSCMPGGELEVRIGPDLELDLIGGATPVFRGRLL